MHVVIPANILRNKATDSKQTPKKRDQEVREVHNAIQSLAPKKH